MREREREGAVGSMPVPLGIHSGQVGGLRIRNVAAAAPRGEQLSRSSVPPPSGVGAEQRCGSLARAAASPVQLASQWRSVVGAAASAYKGDTEDADER